MRQPKWNKYEAALLIESYWKIKDDNSQRNTIIASLSSTLRNRASFEIDDTFRNESGISMRLGELDYLFTGGAVGLKNTSELFREMVKMYCDDRDSFNQILLEAKGTPTNSSTMRERFCKWVNLNYPNLKSGEICQLLEPAEDFCKKLKILITPLFETTQVDIIKKFVWTVTNNKIFYIRNRKHHSAIINAANLYYSFVRELSTINESDVSIEAIGIGKQCPVLVEANPSPEQVTSDLAQLVDKLLKDARDGITKDDICKTLSGFTTHQINLAIAFCHAVKVLKRYYHRDNISDYQEMADIMLEVITRQFSQNGDYTSAQQLYKEVRPKLDDFFFYNNAFDSRQEVYDLAIHLFDQEKYKGNTFVFMNNTHIWKEEPDYPKDYHGLMIKYAREHGNIFSREEAMEYFEQIGSPSPSATFSNVLFTTGSKSFLQYAENQFVLSEALRINEYFLSTVTTQIESLLEGEDYIAMGEIDDYFYTTLPKLPIGVFWSALLLEDVLRVYDTDFTTIEAGKDNDKKTVPAAIVRKKSHYRTFSDVVWSEVSKSFTLPKEFTASEFRFFLLDKGFIRGSEKMWSVHKTVAGDIRFYWTDNNGRVTIN